MCIVLILYLCLYELYFIKTEYPPFLRNFIEKNPFDMGTTIVCGTRFESAADMHVVPGKHLRIFGTDVANESRDSKTLCRKIEMNLLW